MLLQTLLNSLAYFLSSWIILWTASRVCFSAFSKKFLLFMLMGLSSIVSATTFQQVTSSPFATGDDPVSIAFSSEVSGNLFAATANQNEGTVSVYSVDLITGSFTPVSGSPFTTERPRCIAFSPEVSGNLFAALTNSNVDTVSVYSVDLNTGSFTPVSGSPFATGNFPRSVAFSPEVSGNLFAAVTNQFDDTISVYSVDLNTGSFTPVSGSPFATGKFPFSVAFSPEISGNLFAAVTNESDNNVSVYSVDLNTGSFTPIPNSPFAAGSLPLSVAFSPEVSGNLFATVTNANDDNVFVYSVNLITGAFTPVSDSPFATGAFPLSVTFSPEISGNLFAAVTNLHDDTVSVYSVDLITGTFTPISDSPFATGEDPSSVAFSPDVSGNLFAAVTNSKSNTASVFALFFTPTITHISPSSGPSMGGTAVTITGTNLASATAVSFGLTAAASFTVISDTSITAISPAGTGTVDITVTTPGGTSTVTASSAFTYILAPTVTEISPSIGPSTGGTSVTITGTNLSGVTAVLFGFNAATSFTVISDTSITAISPAGTGTVDIIVTTPGGTSAITASSAFTYILAPTVTEISPSSGPSTGGTSVTITGTNLSGITAVLFGFNAATSFTVISDTSIVAVTPRGCGTVAVSVMETSRSATLDHAFTYTPLPPRDLKEIKFYCHYLLLSWKAPCETHPVSYRIYKDAALLHLVRTVPADHKKIFYVAVNSRAKSKYYRYFVVSVDKYGNTSPPAVITIANCHKKRK